MKVIQISPAYKPAYIYGGPTMSVAKLCEALCTKNIQLSVLTTTANGKEELKINPNQCYVVDGVPIMYFKRITKDHTHFSPALLWHLHKTIKESNKNEIIIHIHSWWNLVAILSCWIARWHGVTVFLSPRGMLTAYTQQTNNSLAKKILHHLIGKSLLKYVRMIVSTEQEKQDVFTIVKPKSIEIIPNLVELPNLETEVNYQGANHQDPFFKLIFLSRIEEKKNLEILFRALTKLEFPWKLSIAGSGEKKYVESLKSLAVSFKISNHISWLGHVSNKQKFGLLASNDLLTLTSYNENFANVVIESLSVGTAVLLTKTVGLSEYVKSNGMGWECEISPDSIAEKITQAMQNKHLRDEIRRSTPKRIANDFNEAVLINKYIDCYRQCTL